VRSRHGEYLSASRDGENHFTPPDHPPYLATTTAIPKEPNFFTDVFPQSENSLTWYADFINNVILPSRSIFAPFQLAAEFLMGLALLVGFLTPLTSLAAVFFLLNSFLATFGHDWPWAYFMPIGLLGVCFLVRAERSVGVDAYLHKRFGHPKLPLW
jgi:hypothetical protein